jgi:hypothetical protein
MQGQAALAHLGEDQVGSVPQHPAIVASTAAEQSLAELWLQCMQPIGACFALCRMPVHVSMLCRGCVPVLQYATTWCSTAPSQHEKLPHIYCHAACTPGTNPAPGGDAGGPPKPSPLPPNGDGVPPINGGGNPPPRSSALPPHGDPPPKPSPPVNGGDGTPPKPSPIPGGSGGGGGGPKPPRPPMPKNGTCRNIQMFTFDNRCVAATADWLGMMHCAGSSCKTAALICAGCTT